MENITHTLQELFSQLGLPNEQAAIENFIAIHRPLDSAIALADAPFWSPMQRKFLHDKVAEDADWSGRVDQLDAQLRHV